MCLNYIQNFSFCIAGSIAYVNNENQLVSEVLKLFITKVTLNLQIEWQNFLFNTAGGTGGLELWLWHFVGWPCV
jgi:hypothetical protein